MCPPVDRGRGARTGRRAATLPQIRRLQLTRRALELWLDDPEVEEVVKGCPGRSGVVGLSALGVMGRRLSPHHL